MRPPENKARLDKYSRARLIPTILALGFDLSTGASTLRVIGRIKTGAQAAAIDTVLVPTYPANSPARSATEFYQTPQEPSAASPNKTSRGNRYE